MADDKTIPSIPSFPKLKQGFGADRYKKDPDVDVREFAREQGRAGGKAAQKKYEQGGPNDLKPHRFKEGEEAASNGRRGAEIRWAAWRMAKAAFQDRVVEGMKAQLDPEQLEKFRQGELARKANEARDVLRRSTAEYRRFERSANVPEMLQKRADQLVEASERQGTLVGSPPIRTPGAPGATRAEVSRDLEAKASAGVRFVPVSTAEAREAEAVAKTLDEAMARIAGLEPIPEVSKKRRDF